MIEPGAVQLRFLRIAADSEYLNGDPYQSPFHGSLVQHKLLGGTNDRGSTYRTLGVYDALTIQSVDHFGVSSDPPQEGVKYARNMFCMPLVVPSRTLTQLPPILGTTFLKLNTHTRPNGESALDVQDRIVSILAEQAPSNWSRKNGRVQTVAVFGGFGWHELILLTGASKFSDLLHYVYWLRSEDSPLKRLLSASWTIPGINYPQFLEGRYPEPGDKIHASVLVEVHPGFESVVDEVLSAAASSGHDRPPNVQPNIVFGLYDIKVDFHNAEASEVLRFLQNLRTRGGARVLSSNTQVSIQATTAPQPQSLSLGNINPFRPAPIVVPPDILERYRSILVLNPELIEDTSTPGTPRVDISIYDDLLLLFDIYNMSRYLGAESERYAELRPFLEMLKTSLSDPRMYQIKPASPEAKRLRASLFHVETAFPLGFAQRSGGLETASWAAIHTTGVSPGAMTGMSRILRAAATIPKYVYETVLNAGTWPGFIVSGIEDEPTMYPYGIITLPRRMLLSPRWWWHLAHEAAHYRAIQISLVTERLLLPERLNMAPGSVRPDSLLTEAFCDAVAFRTTFADNWDLFKKFYWRSIQAGTSFDDQSELINKSLRLVITGYVTGKFPLKLPDMELIIPGDLAPKSLVGKDYWRGLQNHFAILRNVYHDNILALKAITDELFKNSRASLEDLDESLGLSLIQGKPIRDVTDPLTLLRASLKLDEQWNSNNAAANSALILSLWNLWERMTYEVTAEAH